MKLTNHRCWYFTTYLIIRKSIPFVIYFLIFSLNSYTQHFINGNIKDSIGFNIEFASIIAKKDSSIISGTFSDSLGSYNLTLPDVGKYSIIYYAVGYKKVNFDIDIKRDTSINIILSEDVTTLSGVQIYANIPTIEKHIDKLIYNPSTLASNKGVNIYDVLKKTPTITADENGNISIKGIYGAGVMIDGRLLQMSNEQIMDYLKSLPSEDIFKIEIISNPSSKYDSQGISGLINILLKRNQQKGITGIANITYEQTYYPKGNTNFNFNLRSSKLNLFGGSSLRIGKYLVEENVQNIYNREVNPYYYSEKGLQYRNEISNFSNLGCDFFISKRHTMGIRLEYSYNKKYGDQINGGTFSIMEGEMDSLYQSLITQKNTYQTISGNINYTFDIDTMGQNLSFDLDYLNYNQPELSATTHTDRYFPNSSDNSPIIFRNDALQRINIFSSKLDYYKPLSEKIFLELGSKFSNLKTENNLFFYDGMENTLNNNKSSDFLYQESNIAGYISFYYQMTTSIAFKLGIRNEYTGLNGKNSDTIVLDRGYNKIFPSFFFQYKKNDDNQLSFSYVQRVDRPDYSNLNPFRYYISPNNYIVGDPFLQPAFTNSFDISYLFKQKYYFSAFLNLTNGQISQAFLLDSETNSYKTLSINIKNSFSYGLNLYLSHAFFDWWQSSTNMLFSINGVSTTLNDEIYKRQNFNFFILNTNQFDISRKHKISLETSLLYQPKGMVQGIFVLGRMLDFSIHIKKSFKNDKTSIFLSVLDIFNSAYITAKVDDVNQYSFINGNYDRRGIRLSFSHKFGRKNIKEQRDKNNSIEDEQRRLK